MIRDLLITSFRDEIKDLIKNIKSVRFWKMIVFMCLGMLLFSAAVNGIIIPHQFLSGGVSGVSLVVFYLTGWPSVGVIYLILNIPIFIVGWKEISLYFIVISLIGVIIFTFALEITADIVLPSHDHIMAAVLAGVMMGFGVGLYLRVGGTAGGLDIIAIIVKRRLGIPMGTTFFILNVIPLGAAVFISNLDSALYTGISMYVYSVVLEKVQTGFSQRQSVFIVTSKPDEIAQEVMRRIDRGVTFLYSSGGFTRHDGRVIYTVINMKELGRLKQLLFDLDPEAFVAINNTTEVIGRKFLSWEDEGFQSKPKSLQPQK